MKKQLLIAGLDEVGRGAWAGPVFTAAVILPKGIKLPGLTDSKLLTAKKREWLAERIKKTCIHAVGEASQEEVDQFGLTKACELAFQRALAALPVKPDQILIDGRDTFNFGIPTMAVIRGDQKHRCISAASVLAKVTRDQLLTELAKKHPEYGFEIHKGYGTKCHQRALSTHGPCLLHRKSYRPIQSIFESISSEPA